MIISYAWTTEALLAGRKKVTRRDWSREYAARFRAGTAHDAYDRLPRVHGKKVGDVRIATAPYPERSCDIPDEDFEGEGLKYMEERGLLIRGITPREWFDNWRSHKDILFVVRFDLVFKCDRCGAWTTAAKFGPGDETMRLCPLCWVDWTYFADHEYRNEKDWRRQYDAFCATERKGVIHG